MSQKETGSPVDSPSSRLLARFLEGDIDLDEVFERLLATRVADETPVVQAVIPGEVLASGDESVTEFLDSVVAEYEEIEEALAGLRELTGEHRTVSEDAVGVVSEEELSDPAALKAALEPLPSEAARFEFLYEVARAALDRLDGYELSRRPPSALVQALEEEGNFNAAQYLVEFLRALHRAADSFEALQLPGHHVREYLRHLYLMRDWMEMRRLVQGLEVATESTLGHWRHADAKDADVKL